MQTLITDLLNKVYLKIGSECVQIVEVELYLNPDPYVHGKCEQTTFGCWYFHKSGDTPGPFGFKSGNYKGMDLCIGTKDCPAGILIRSIRLLTNELIEGPCKTVDFVLSKTGYPNIASLVNSSFEYPPRCNDPNFPLSLAECASRNDPIYSGPRVGLTYRANRISQLYYTANLRFTTHPGLSKCKFSLVTSFLTGTGTFTDLEEIVQAKDKLAPRNFEPDEIVKRSACELFKVSGKKLEEWWEGIKFGVQAGQNGFHLKSLPKNPSVLDQCRTYGSLW